MHIDISKNQKIAVAMSGGVDSSTVAAWLAHQGYNVIGLTMQLYSNTQKSSGKTCCSGVDILDASNVAKKMGFTHHVINYERVFKRDVIDEFAKSYLAGETPIPCIRCNQTVKFRDMILAAKQLGASALVTGHYVRRIQNKIPELHSAIDASKDQSYFLFATTQEQLNYLRFPLGVLHKSDTREIARELDLNISEKPESQDICFVKDGSYKNLIKKMHKTTPGNIIDKYGIILGIHDGIAGFTVGQRRGIGISTSAPLYVLKINPETNEVVVGKKEDLLVQDITIGEINWLGDNIPDCGLEATVKLRSMHTPVTATIYLKQDDKINIKLYTEQYGISPGQACVIYHESRILGGGFIVRN